MPNTVAVTVAGSSVIGSQRSIWGTLVVDGTGAAFSTGLKYVNSINVTCSDAKEAALPKLELNMNVSTPTNGDVTLTCASGEYTNSNFMAIGYGGG